MQLKHLQLKFTMLMRVVVCHKRYKLSGCMDAMHGGESVENRELTNKAPHPLQAIISTQSANGWTRSNAADGKN